MKPSFPVLPALLPIVLAAAAVSVSPARAQEELTYRDKLFRQLDHNADGRLSQQEFIEGVLYAAFHERDANKDRKVSRAEWSRAETHESAPDEFGRLDADADGFVTYAETFAHQVQVQALKAYFSKIDRDGDGFVSPAELPAAR